MPTFDSIFIDVVILNTNVILSRSCDKFFFVGSQFYCDFIEKKPENTFTKTFSRKVGSSVSPGSKIPFQRAVY